MYGARSPLSRKVWMGFALVVAAIVVLVVGNYLIYGSEDDGKGLKDGFLKTGEPLGECLSRTAAENPSYSEELVQRLCEGR